MNEGLAVAAPVSELTRVFRPGEPFALESGTVLPAVEVAYRTWGRLNEAGDNAVLVCHALTGSADADEWWSGLFGEGQALDPQRDFIVCSNVLGGCYGTTGPLAPLPGERRRYGSHFPRISIRDMVRLQARLLDALGVKLLSLVVGPSLGGMQVLEWAAGFPQRVKAIAPIGVSARHSAWCIGLSEIQRQAIYADPAWEGGEYSEGAGPESGLSVARMVAMCSYRSWANFEHRFGRELRDQDSYQVESYLRYQGQKLCGRFDANSYVRLTQAMDTHDLGRGRGPAEQVLAAMDVPALVVSVTSDVLYPPHEQAFLARHLPRADYRELDSDAGHDGFLIELNALNAMLVDFRRASDAHRRRRSVGA